MSVKPYPLPDPKERPESFLTIVYKTMKRVSYDDRIWDKEFFGRCNKRTAMLLETVGGDIKAAVQCMRDGKEYFEGQGLSWTIETLCSYAFDWKAERTRKSDRECMRELFGAYSGASKGLERGNVLGLLENVGIIPSEQSASSPMKAKALEVLDEKDVPGVAEFEQLRAALKGGK